MWGPNAVDGVINIITKSARDTKGVRVSSAGGTGSRTPPISAGARGNDRAAWRTWGRFEDLTPAYGSAGFYNLAAVGPFRAPSIGNLDSVGGAFGFRGDGQFSDRDRWMVEGNIFTTDRKDPLRRAGAVSPWISSRACPEAATSGGVFRGVGSTRRRAAKIPCNSHSMPALPNSPAISSAT